MPPTTLSEPFVIVTRDAHQPVARLALNRPDVHNAFNETLIAQFRQALATLRAEIDAGSGPRVLVVTGNGKSFCAGADLNWMRKQKDASRGENLNDALEAAWLFRDLDEMPCATIARINGAAVGGGTGVVAACDIPIAVDTAQFGFSEVKMGLAPAVISPYVLRRIGEREAREWFLTGERFDAKRALQMHLVQYVVEPAGLDAAIEARIEQLLSAGPLAIRACKELIRGVARPAASAPAADLQAFTAETIARLRVSPEGQEGIGSFLEKRKAAFNASRR